jgi:hypothetical protein
MRILKILAWFVKWFIVINRLATSQASCFMAKYESWEAKKRLNKK